MKKIIVYLIVCLFLISSVSAETPLQDLREDVRDAREDVRDLREDIRDKREDVYDRTNQDYRDCVDKCTELGEENCETICKIKDKREDILDRREDVRDAREDVRDLREDIMDRRRDPIRINKVKERKTQKLDELDKLKENPKLLKYNEAKDFKARSIAKNKLQKAKGDYLKAKERSLTARKNYLTAQNEFREVKEKLKACKDEDTEECEQLREQIIERAKEFLLKTADNILEHLDKVKANVESNEDLTEEEASEILEEIDGMIGEIEDAKSTIESSEDKEEIKEAAKTIKKAWLRIKRRLAVHTGRIVNARIGGIIVKTKHLEAKLEKILERMEEKGIDTTEIQTLVDDFNLKIEEAKNNYESAVDKFKEAKSAEDTETAQELAEEGHKYMKVASEALQEAQHLLRDIVLSVKEAGGQEDLTAVVEEEEEETEEEVEEEEETEEEVEEEETEEEVEEEEELEEVNLAEIEKPNCWVNKPSYRPGYDKGYFIWQGKCANFIWVDWSGDTRGLWHIWRRVKGLTTEEPTVEEVEQVEQEIESGEIELEEEDYEEIVEEDIDTITNCSDVVCEESKPTCSDEQVLIKTTDGCCAVYKCVIKPKLLYKVKGRITSNGKIIDVGARRFEGVDVFKYSNNVIKFKGVVGPHFDGLYFRTKGNKVLMELWFDGKKETRLINIGENKRHPLFNPFVLKVRPAKRPQTCGKGEIIYNEKCATTIEGETVTSSDTETVVTDDGSLSDSEFSSTTVESASGTTIDVST